MEGTQQIDLAAYLARIGLPAPPPADAAGLAAVQRAHRLAIPFENLDIALGRGIDLDPPAIFDKIVTRRRGGYCFEQNRLFLDALHALGFDARPLLARVWLGAEGTPPTTHTLNLVTIDGTEWIADAGFGAAYAPPMRLGEGEEAISPDGARHRLLRDAEHGWMLERHGDSAHTDGRAAAAGADDGWMPQYSCTLDPVWPADLALANHWTSTAPGTRFLTHRIVSIVLPTGFASFLDRHYNRANSGKRLSGEVESAKAYRMRLSLMFGIDLTEEEVAGLGLFPSTEPR